MRQIFFIAAFFLLFGCTFNIPPEQKFVSADLTLARFSPQNEMACQPLDDPKPCYCMVCQNTTSWLGLFDKVKFLSSWFDSNLYEGKCEFRHCNLSDMVNFIEQDKNTQLRSFMLGGGPTHSAVDLANTYCNYSLQFSTKWLIGTQTVSPPIPKKTQAKCWLERNILPFYIYFTEGKNIDPVRTGEIAKALNGTGPVFLTTEAWLDPRDPFSVQKVKEQIDQIKANCNKCLVVLMLNGTTADRKALLKEFFGTGDIKTGAGFSQYYKKVDVVGFGILANDYPTCNPVDVIGENFLFSRFVLKNYSKPTIWLYVGVSKGNNSFNSCTWTDSQIHLFYQQLFASTQAMASSGVIGIGFYEFSDHSGPIPCDNRTKGCEFGFLDVFGNQKHPVLNSWSSLCQYFGTEQFRSLLIFSRNGYGSVCDPGQLQNNKMFRAISLEINSPKQPSYSFVAPAPKQKYIRCGDICVSDVPLKDWTIFDNTNKQFDSSHCDIYSFIEEEADKKEISALFFRAIIEQESNFDKFAVSCISKDSPNCNTANLTVAEICRLAGMPDDCGRVPGTYWNDAQIHSECPPHMKPCAFGLAQCIAYPGAYYVQNNLAMPPEIRNCGKSKSGKDYNPFDPYDSVCCGTSLFKYMLDFHPSTGWSFVNRHWNSLTECTGGVKDDKGWLAYLLAAETYYGHLPPSISSFLSQRDQNGKCQGIQHYVDYMRSVGHVYSMDVMSRYLDAIEKCGAECPGKEMQIIAQQP
ncbi:MAG: hypothetical protein QXT25_02100 [Candidatus Anstonellaceae archaeon]